MQKNPVFQISPNILFLICCYCLIQKRLFCPQIKSRNIHTIHVSPTSNTNLISQVSQQEKHANALPYSTVLLPVSHGYTTETAIVLILTFSPVFSVSVPLLLDVSSCSVPSSSWFAGAGRWFCLSIYN